MAHKELGISPVNWLKLKSKYLNLLRFLIVAMLPMNCLLVNDRNSNEDGKLLFISSLRKSTSNVIAGGEHGDGTCEIVVNEDPKL